MFYPKTLCLILLMLIAGVCKGQGFYDIVDIEKIQEQRVRDFIVKHIPEDNKINDIQATLHPGSDLNGYYKQEKSYFFNDNIDSLWAHYTSTQPADGWDSKIISMELMCSKSNNVAYYSDDNSGYLEIGQVVFLNLKFLRGVYNLAMAFEVTSINPRDYIMEISYVEGNLSKGKQMLEFKELSNSKTVISHSSYYRSESKIRDHLVYPFFHNIIINSFHRNMKGLMERM